MRATPVPAFSPPDLITAAAVQEGDLVAVMGTIVPGPVGWSDPWGNDSGGFWVTTMHPFGTEPFVRVLAEAPEGFQVVMAFGRVHWWNGRAILADAEVRFWGHSYEWWLGHRYDERERPSRQSVLTPSPQPRGFRLLSEPESVTIPQAKLSPDGAWVQLDAQIVSAAFDGFFYIETEDRACGIRVEAEGYPLSVGRRATVVGAMRTNDSGERYIAAVTAYQSGPESVWIGPLSLNNRCVGGGDWRYDPESGAGQKGIHLCQEMNNIGLLVRAWGHVTHCDTNGEFFYIDDGAALDDGFGHTGVKVATSGQFTLPSLGALVFVTGVSGMCGSAQEPKRVILTRGLGDIACPDAVMHVWSDAYDDTGNGLTWATAKKTIQGAIGAAAPSFSREIWVAAGTYEPVEIEGGDEDMAIYGGFDGTETYREQRDWATNETTTDGGWNGPAAYCHDLASGYPVTIDGFSIQHGDPGIQCEHAAMVVTHNKITDNDAGLAFGGGVYCEDSALTIADNEICSNTAGYGAGIACYGSSATVARNVVADNVAGTEGGGLHCEGASATVTGNTFQGNVTFDHGGAIALHDSTGVTIANNLFVGNSCSGPLGLGGGAIHSRSSGPLIVNNTFVDNRVGSGDWPGGFTPAAYGGAIHVRGTPQTKLINNIFSGNLAVCGNSVASTDQGVVNVSYSDAWPAGESLNYAADTGGQYNLGFRCLYVAPGFYSPSTGQYSLGAGSQLRTDEDKHGQSPSADPDVPDQDIESHPRPGPDGLTDMGAYENDGRP